MWLERRKRQIFKYYLMLLLINLSRTHFPNLKHFLSLVNHILQLTDFNDSKVETRFWYLISIQRIYIFSFFFSRFRKLKIWNFIMDKFSTQQRTKIVQKFRTYSANTLCIWLALGDHVQLARKKILNVYWTSEKKKTLFTAECVSNFIASHGEERFTPWSLQNPVATRNKGNSLWAAT